MSTKQFTERRMFTDTSWTIIKDNYDENGNNKPEVLCGYDPLRFTPVVLNADGTVSENISICSAGSKKVMARELTDYCKKMNITTASFRLVIVYRHVYDHHIDRVLDL